MKTILFTLLLFINLLSFSFTNEEVDNGFNIIKIDAKIGALKNYLIKLEFEKWNNEAKSMEGYITSGWLFDLQKAGVSLFFGQKITRIEIYMNGTEEEAGEDVYSFDIIFPTITEKTKLKTLIGELENKYGPASIRDNEETGEAMRLDWYAKLTLLSIELGTVIETGETMGYFRANFRQAYGG